MTIPVGKAAAEDCSDNGSVFCKDLSTFSEQAAKLLQLKDSYLKKWWLTTIFVAVLFVFM